MRFYFQAFFDFRLSFRVNEEKKSKKWDLEKFHRVHRLLMCARPGAASLATLARLGGD